MSQPHVEAVYDTLAPLADGPWGWHCLTCNRMKLHSFDKLTEAELDGDSHECAEAEK